MYPKVIASAIALILMTGTASATLITLEGSYTLNSTGTNGTVDIVNELGSAFTLPLTVGVIDTENFIALTPHNGNGGDFTIDAAFIITQPGSGSNTDNGNGTLDVHGNTVNGGSFVWSDGPFGTNVTLSDGSILNIDLSDVLFNDGSTQTVTASFELMSFSDPPSPEVPAVPEPASLTLLGAGLVVLGLMRRGRKGT